MDKCFADKDDYCSALTKKECKNCKFYKSEKDLKNTEEEITLYSLKEK